MYLTKDSLANLFRKAAALTVKGAGLGMYVANGVTGDIQSAEFFRTAGAYEAAKMESLNKHSLRIAFRNTQIGAAWVVGLFGAQLASWATRDPFAVQHAAYTGMYLADKVRTKKALDNGPQRF